jgi:hypothetical protein
MNVSQVTSNPHAATGTQPTTAATPVRLTAANVSAAALKAANGDGDGKTGTAALNDGDTAAQSARRGAVNITA